MEDDIAELAQIALLRGYLDDPAVGAIDPPPAAQLLRHPGGDLLGGAADGRLGVLGQPAEIAGGRHRTGAQAAQVLQNPRSQTTHQRDEQQHVDGGEPETGEHVEQLQPVQPRSEGRMLTQVLRHLGLVEAALRQQGPGHRTQCQQKQQNQRGAHGGQGPPPPQREQTHKPRTPRRVGGLCVCSRLGHGHMGSLTSLTRLSRTQEMNSFHSPVSSATPTPMSRMPPKTWMARV